MYFHRSLARRPYLAPAAALLVLSVGCAPLGPDYVPPELDAPAAWTAARQAGLLESEAELRAWWEDLGDPQLAALVERAFEANLDLHHALSRIQEVRAFRGVVTPDLLPTLNLGGSYGHSQSSREVAGGQFLPRTQHRFTLGLDAAWELDVWGRVRREVEAASADIEASVEDARAVLLSVAAEVAVTYVELRTFQDRTAIAQSNLATQQQTLDLSRARFAAGIVGELDVAQARSILESTRATLPPLEAGARAARNRLAVLLGVPPGTLEAELSERKGLPVPRMQAGVGMPADLLRRRPDLRRAERMLAAQTARIGVAEGDLYPRFELTGSLGSEADDPGSLFSSDGIVFGYGPAFTWNLFDRDRVRSAIAVETERTRQARITYEQTLLLALEEVENAMTGFVRDQASQQALMLAVDQTRIAVELSRDQYRRGLVDFQRVLDSQLRLFDLEDQLVTVRSSITIRLIQLYKALGGGWELRDVQLSSAEEEEGSQS